MKLAQAAERLATSLESLDTKRGYDSDTECPSCRRAIDAQYEAERRARRR